MATAYTAVANGGTCNELRQEGKKKERDGVGDSGRLSHVRSCFVRTFSSLMPIKPWPTWDGTKRVDFLKAEYKLLDAFYNVPMRGGSRSRAGCVMQEFGFFVICLIDRSYPYVTLAAAVRP